MNGVVVGREREIDEANGFLAEAAQRSCGLLFAGAAGIGKTTIWSAVVDDAGACGYTVLVARPSEAETELAFAVLTDLFAHLDGDALAQLPTVQRVALEHALRRRESTSRIDPIAVALGLLAALRVLSRSGPVLVAIDDLQWLDAPSLRALTFAYRRLERSPVGLLATVRTEHDDELTQLAARQKDSLRRIDVGGLGERELLQLAHERTGRSLTPAQLRRVARMSGGNPYYALELAVTVDGDATGVPESLGAAIRTRLSTLSPGTRRMALTAALVGRFEEPMLTEPALDELRAAGIVEVRAGVPRFMHPLLSSTLVTTYTDAQRRAVHLELAAVLADPDERALHLARGTEVASDAVARELESAAERQDARGAPETAALLVERAAALTPPDDRDATTRRLMRAADLYQAAGEANEHVYPLLERLAQTLAPGADRARVLMRVGWLGAQIDTIATSEAVAYQERALAEADGAPDVVAGAHAVLARMVGIGGDYRGALRHAEFAVAAGTTPSSNLMFPSPLGELGSARFYTGRGFDEQLFADGIAAEERSGRVGEPYQSSKVQLGLVLLYTGDFARARVLLLEQLARSIEHDRVRSRAGCVLHLVELEVRAGNLAMAEAYAAEFVHLDRQLRGDLCEEWYPSGVVAVHLGRVDEARRILDAGIAYCGEVGATVWLAHSLEALGHLELVLGHHAAARDALASVPPILRAAGLEEWCVHPFHADAIETLIELGEVDEAGVLTAELEEYGRRLDRPWGLAAAARSRALVASALGAHDEALEAVEDALREHVRLAWPFERARTLLVQGRILRRLGRRRDAGAALADAGAAFALLRNPLWRSKVEVEERRLGGRRGASDALTPTEARVAELASEGLRNAEIAARLFVTSKTVEAALSRVYRKLGIRSRTELARRLARESVDS